MVELPASDKRAEDLQKSISDLGDFEVRFFDAPHNTIGVSVFYPQGNRGVVITTRDRNLDFSEKLRPILMTYKAAVNGEGIGG